MSELISVVIPTFNAAPYLEQCLASIALQRDENCEVLVIDGGSVDGTEKVVKKFGSLITRFVSEKDFGQGDAVGKGLLRAKGQIHHWHAADDLVLPGAFSSVRSAFKSKPDAAIVFSDGLAFNETGIYRTGKCRWITYQTSLYHFGRFQSDCAYWRAELTPAGLPLDLSQPLSVDEDFFLRIWQGRAHVWLNRPLGAFRLREGQLSGVLKKERLAADRLATRKSIYVRDGISPGAESTRRLTSLPSYLFREKLMSPLDSAVRVARRRLSGDRARKSAQLHLVNFLEEATTELAEREFEELGKSIATGLV